MKPDCQLLLVHQPRVAESADLLEVAGWVRELDPGIHTVVVQDRDDGPRLHGEILDLPAVTVAPARLLRFRPPPGAVFAGPDLAKDAEYRLLETAGLPVPRWALLTETQQPDLAGFGDYVVMKPARSGRGADVRILRRGRVRWRPPKTEFTQKNNRKSCSWIVQEFVYTGRWPAAFRVATLFGTALWAWRSDAARDRQPLPKRYAFGSPEGAGVSIVSSGRGSHFELASDPEIIALAERAHAAFPGVPLLGVDVLRDAESGRLYIIEVNSSGFTWHFSSPIGRDIQGDFGFRLEDQFDGRRRAAAVLARICRRHASRQTPAAPRATALPSRPGQN